VDVVTTVSWAGVVVADPWLLVNTASYSYPLFAADVTEYVVAVAPLIADHDDPSFVETDH
jgi:hypothetical protein